MMKTRQRTRQQRKSWTWLLMALALLGMLAVVGGISADNQNPAIIAWERAATIGKYSFDTQMTQTETPLARAENVGRTARTEAVVINGFVDRQAETFDFSMRPMREGAAAVSYKVEDGQTWMQEGNGEWELTEQAQTLFSADNDPLLFLKVAENMTLLSADAETPLTPDFLPEGALDGVERYSFDINSVEYANLMHEISDEHLRTQEAMPAGFHAQVDQALVNMVATGELWLNESGLPTRLAVDIVLPESADALVQTDAQLVTTFSNWDSSPQIMWTLVTEQPSLLLTQNGVLPSISPTVIYVAALMFALLAGALAMGQLLQNRRIRWFAYRAFAYGMTAIFIFSPLGSVVQAHAARDFSSRQLARVETQDAMLATQSGPQELFSASVFNPHVAPQLQAETAELANRYQAALADLANPTLSSAALFSTGTVLTDCESGLYNTGEDCDSDGLSNEVELLKLGTDPSLRDTDGDLIDDYLEVTGFTLGGKTWYLNPRSYDSNGDGRLDMDECPELVDISGNWYANKGLTVPACADSDGDNVPDVWDYDDDNDSVPDGVDNTPHYTGTLSTELQDSVDLKITNYNSNRSLLVDMQIRPEDTAHLYYANTIVDWPTGDTEGQVRRTTDKTIAELTSVSGSIDASSSGIDYSTGDVRVSPVLRISIPWSTNNQTANLPVRSDYTGTINKTDPLSTWLDEDRLQEGYGINVSYDEEGGDRHVYVPLSVIQDETGDGRVGWNATMLYEPTDGSWDASHTIELMWLVYAINDECAEWDEDDATECLEWTEGDELEVVHTYFEPFQMTDVQVKEYIDTDVALLAQDSSSQGVNHKMYQWYLMDGLLDAFIGGQLVNGTRFDVAEIGRRFTSGTNNERWKIPAESLHVHTSLDHPDYIDAMTSVSDYMDTYLNTAYTDDSFTTATVIIASDETYRAAQLGDDAMSYVDNQLTVDMSGIDSVTSSSLNWGPYSNNGSTWEPADLTETTAALEAKVLEDLTDSVVTTMFPELSTAQIPYAKEAIANVAQNTYLTHFQGSSALTSFDGSSTSTITVDNSALAFDDSNDDLTWLISAAESAIRDIYAGLESIEKLTLDGLTVATSIYSLPTFGELIQALGTSAALSHLSGGAQSISLSELPDEDDLLDKGTLEYLYNYWSGTFYQTTGIDKAVLGSEVGRFSQYKQRVMQGYLIVSVVSMFLIERFRDGYVLSEDFEVYFLAITGTLSGFADLGQSLVAAYSLLNNVGVSSFSKIQTLVTKGLKSAGAWGVVGVVVMGAVMALALYGSGRLQWGTVASTVFLYSSLVQFMIALVFWVLMMIPGVNLVVAIVTTMFAIWDSANDIWCQAANLDDDHPACFDIMASFANFIVESMTEYVILLDLSDSDRLEMGDFEYRIDAPELGANVNNKLWLTMTVALDAELATGFFYSNDAIILSSTYDLNRQEARDHYDNTKFDYALTQNQSLQPDATNRIAVDSAITTTQVTGELYYSKMGAGINKTPILYLAERVGIPAMFCHSYIVAAACDKYRHDHTSYIDLGSGLGKIDIFPASIEKFMSLTYTNDNSYRLAWDTQFPTLHDADGDGLVSKYYNGDDPDDSRWDTDGDGLSDYYESVTDGYNPLRVDGDCDGLSDYYEALFETDPSLADTDGDGLQDGDERFHPATWDANCSNAAPSAGDYEGGWGIVYDYDGTTGLTTWIDADPTTSDSDADGITDRFEQVYGYNPWVLDIVNVLQVGNETLKGRTSTREGYMTSGDWFDYTVTITNELDINRTAYGLFETELPVDVVESTDTFILPGKSTLDVTGSIQPDANLIANSGPYSVTLRAGAVIDDGEIDLTEGLYAWYAFDKESGNEARPYHNLISEDSYTGEATCPWALWGTLEQNLDCPENIDGAAYFEYERYSHTTHTNCYYLELYDVTICDSDTQYYDDADELFVSSSNDYSQSFSFNLLLKPDSDLFDPLITYRPRFNVVGWDDVFSLAINPFTRSFSVDLYYASGSDCSGSLASTTVTTSNNVMPTDWFVLSGTHDGTTLTLYVDGQYVDSFAHTSCPGSGAFQIGNGPSTDYPDVLSFFGYMRDFKLYTRVLDAKEIYELSSSAQRTVWLPFDEAPGQTEFASEAEYPIIASCTSCPESGHPGIINQALHFDGTQALTIEAANGDDLDELGMNTSQFLSLSDKQWTFGTWIYNEGPAEWTTLIDGNIIQFNLKDDQLAYKLFYSNEYVELGTVPTGEWAHIALVNNSSDAAFLTEFYLNGVYQAEAVLNSYMYIDMLTIADGFIGLLDELVFFSAALEESEIAELVETAPLVNLHLDEDLPTTTFVNIGREDADGTCSNCPATGVNGRMREAAQFDRDDVISVDSEVDLNEWATSFWFRPQTGYDNWQFPVQHSGEGSSKVQLHFVKDSLEPVARLIACDGTDVQASADYELTPHIWTHVAIVATQDDEDLTVTLYLNGNPVKSQTKNAPSCTTTFDTVNVGYKFIGEIDEVAVYNVALEAGSILNTYEYQSSWYDFRYQPTIYVDNDAPTVDMSFDMQYVAADLTNAIWSLDVDGTGSEVEEVEAKLYFAAEDVERGLRTSVDNDVWLITQPTWLTAGDNFELRLTATDSVGHESSRTVPFTVDGNGPTATLDSSRLYVHTVGDVTIGGTLSDDYSGVSTTEVLVRITSERDAATKIITPTVNTDGTWSAIITISDNLYDNLAVEMTVYDNVGNQSIIDLGVIDVANNVPTAEAIVASGILSPTDGVINGIVHSTPFARDAKQTMRFEEADGATQFVDATGNGVNGTCVSCPSRVEAGKLGAAVYFDGADSLTLSASNAMSTTDQLGLYDDSFTVMVWVRGDFSSGNHVILGSDSGFALGILDGAPYMAVNDNSNATVASSPVVPSNEWTHLTFRYRSIGIQDILVNGEWMAGNSGRAALTVQSALTVGSIGSNYFVGDLDELHIFGRALSDLEVGYAVNPVHVGVESAEIRFRTSDTERRLLELSFDHANDLFANSGVLTETFDCVSCMYATSAGVSGLAAEFDGDHRVQSEVLAENWGDGAYTVAAWVNLDQVNTNGWHIIFHTDNGIRLTMPNGSAQPQLAAVDGCGGSWIQTAAADSLALNTWTHVAATYEDGLGTLYIDSSPVATVTLGTLCRNAVQTVKVGKGIIGSIDEVVVLGSALDANGIASLRNEWQPLTLEAPVFDILSHFPATPLAHFPLDEGDATAYADDLSDLTVANSGYIVGTDGIIGDGVTNPTGDTNAKLQQSFSNADWVNGQFSFSAWINPAQMTSANHVLIKYTSTNQAANLRIDKDTLTPELRGMVCDGSNLTLQSDTDLTLGEWNHLVGTYDGTTAKLYLNGGLVGSRDVAWCSGSQDVTLTLAQNLQGSLDEVSVFSQALTAEQVESLYDLPNTFSDDNYYTWSAQAAAGLNDYIHIDLKVTNSYGNIGYRPSAWQGVMNTVTAE